MTKVRELHKKWMKNKDYRKAREELAPEFALARAMIQARITAGLTRLAAWNKRWSKGPSQS
jgi:hypothetical protein